MRITTWSEGAFDSASSAISLRSASSPVDRWERLHQRLPNGPIPPGRQAVRNRRRHQWNSPTHHRPILQRHVQMRRRWRRREKRESGSFWFAVDELSYSHPGALLCRSCCCCEHNFPCCDHMVQLIGLNAFCYPRETHVHRDVKPTRLLMSNCDSFRVMMERLCKCRYRCWCLSVAPTLLHWV